MMDAARLDLLLRPTGASWPLPNVWLGATVVNQAEADRDIPKLLATPAAVRFLSVEPMLGPIDLHIDPEYGTCPLPAGWNALDWVIAGGESGSGARPSNPQWYRDLRDQCAAAEVPFLFKQWGEWTPGANVHLTRGTVAAAYLTEEGWAIYPHNLAGTDGHIDDEPDLYRVGKKAAGRLLDGVQHDGYPGARA